MATVSTEEGAGKVVYAEPAPAPRRPPAAVFIGFSGADVALRALLFAVTLAALVVLATAKQTVLVPYPLMPRILLPIPAKFKDSPALIYLLVALCVTCFYSLLTALSSLRLIAGSGSAAKTLFVVLLLDVLVDSSPKFYAAVMASATGAGGGVAWIGLKGNSHTQWNKICNVYGKFCRHIGSSVFLALVASIILVLLAVLNAHALYRRTH